MVVKKFLLFLILLFFPIFVGANFYLEDFKFYKNLNISELISKDNLNCGNSNCNFYFEIDEEIYINSPVFLNDMRVIRNDGKEIPYFIKQDNDIFSHNNEIKEIKIISVKNTTCYKKSCQIYILDLGENPEFHKKIEVRSNSKEFRRQIKIFGSNKINSNFKTLNLDLKESEIISSLPGQEDLLIKYRFNKYRYLKLNIYGNEGEFIIEKFLQNFDRVNIKRGEKRFNEVKINLLKTSNINDDVFLLDLEQQGIYVEKLNLNFLESIFRREYILYGSNFDPRTTAEFINWRKISTGEVFKNIYDSNLIIDIFDNQQFYKLILKNKEKAQLNLVGANFESFIHKVYLPNNLNFKKYYYKVFFGNNKIKNNTQNISLIDTDNYILLSLSSKKNNPKFKSFDNKKQKNLFKEWYYFLFLFFFLILIWFFYKVYKERKSKFPFKNKKNFLRKVKK